MPINFLESNNLFKLLNKYIFKLDFIHTYLSFIVKLTYCVLYKYLA